MKHSPTDFNMMTSCIHFLNKMQDQDLKDNVILCTHTDFNGDLLHVSLLDPKQKILFLSTLYQFYMRFV